MKFNVLYEGAFHFNGSKGSKKFIILSLLLSSCGLPYCHKVQLTEDDLSWINHYHENDTILYKSNHNNRDTLIVKRVGINNPRNTFILDTEGQNWIEGDNEYYGFAYVDMMLKHSPDTFHIGFEIERNDRNGKLIYGCIFCEWGWLNKKMDLVCVKIGRKYYKNCIRRDITQMEHNYGEQSSIGLKEVIWNKKLGLLQYSLENGEKFMIQK